MTVSKKFVLILFAGISFATANAQGQLQFGIKGGLNLSTVTVSNGFDGYSYSALPNFNAGVFVKIPVVRFFSVQPEVYYSGQGFKDNDGSGGEYSEHINYLNIPVLAKFTSRSGLFLETGPQVSLKLSAKEKENGLSEDVSSGYNSADFSWVFGAGYKFPASPVGFDFRYNTGITNIANDSYYGNGYGQYAVRNGVFQIDLYVILFHTPGR
jgi:Outer membrane protein beta-barrel domain